MKKMIIKAVSVLTMAAIVFSAVPTTVLAAKKMSISAKSKTIYAGNEFKLKIKNQGRYFVTWKSDKKSIADVNYSGTVSAKKKGSAKITATAKRTTTTLKKVKGKWKWITKKSVKKFRGILQFNYWIIKTVMPHGSWLNKTHIIRNPKADLNTYI